MMLVLPSIAVAWVSQDLYKLAPELPIFSFHCLNSEEQGCLSLLSPGAVRAWVQVYADGADKPAKKSLSVR